MALGQGIFPSSIGSGAAAPVNPTTVSDLFGAIDAGVTDFAQADAEGDIATGDAGEASAYQNAAAIAQGAARVAQVSGSVQEAQEGLQVQKTLGSQRAAVAAGGFGESGSALDLLRSSTRQGLLQQQIIGVNAEEQASGYLAQGAASTAEASAASAAANSAASLASSDAAMGVASKTNAGNEAAAMGLSIPGLSGLSATSIPTVNPVTVGESGSSSGGLPTEFGSTIGGGFHAGQGF